MKVILKTPLVLVVASTLLLTLRKSLVLADDGPPCDTPDAGCPVARCMEPPDGCQYIFDHYVLFENGKCCASLCYAVDEQGNECSLDNDTNKEDVPSTPESPEPGQPCDTPDANCPMARCLEPPEGCQYIFDHYVIFEDGNCCASLCYAVDEQGNQCSFDDDVETTTPETPEAGEPCEIKNEFCAIADCAEAPPGCSFDPNLYINQSGECCPKLCHAIDEDGNECSNDNDSTPATSPEIGEPCDTMDQFCPIAACAIPPEGCTLDARLYITPTGECCPKLCHAVDEDGNECSFDLIDNITNTTNATTTDDFLFGNVTMGETCEPTGEELCPVADCSNSLKTVRMSMASMRFCRMEAVVKSNAMHLTGKEKSVLAAFLLTRKKERIRLPPPEIQQL